jgi:hypothetical protein
MFAVRRFGCWLSLLAFGVGCTFVDPHVGALQAACEMAAGPVPSGQGTGSYGMTPKAQSTPICASNTGNACDDCENAHCCPTHSACYGDPVCACADLALDECLDAIDAGPADHQTRVSDCWSAFAAKGSPEQARVSCQRSRCQTECGVP